MKRRIAATAASGPTAAGASAPTAASASAPAAPRRRSLVRALPVAVLSALAGPGLSGCIGGSRPAHAWWELEDAGAGAPGAARPDPARQALSLLVEGTAAGALYEGTALLYGRAAGMRAPYQYASWTERPAGRIARLAQRRLAARGGFRDVSLAEAGTATDLLLSLTLESLYHDLDDGSGTLRLEMAAQLVDWRARRPLASRRFAVDEAVASADAAGAAQAAGRAVGRLLDALAPWVEAGAAELRAAGLSRAGRTAPR